MFMLIAHRWACQRVALSSMAYPSGTLTNATNDRSRIADLVDLTFGTHFELYRRAALGIGVVTPITAPRLFEVEAIANFNIRF